MNTTSIFFNQSFDKKRLKVFLYWILKTFGEKEALIVVEQLKSMGFYNATKAGLSIGLHDLKTPSNKRFLISDAQVTMRKTDQEFQGAEVTATERSQRIVDTWHRTSEDLRKQVVNYFSTYDQLNSVYMMALSGARGNFSQVRQLIGMRGLMADPQGQIISFPIRSNLREGLTLTEYFISCSGARKGLVDTALRTADTGYLTRRLVDISHHIVVKKVTCYTARGVALKTLRTPQKILLPLRERLVGRVLAETIYGQKGIEHDLKQKDFKCSVIDQNKIALFEREERQSQRSADQIKPRTHLNEKITKQAEPISIKEEIIARKNQEISADLALKISFVKEKLLDREKLTHSSRIREDQNKDYKGVNSKGSSQITDTTVPQVLVRSPLTCTYTHEICQLCYGWSMAQGTLVSLGEAVGVIAGQSIGEPGTQLTMRTFHTGGVFSGDLLQEIRAPHSGRILFPKALQGLLVRTSQGKVAFLIKVSGEVLVDATDIDDQIGANKTTRLQLEPSTILFVRQGERVKSHQILAELAITSQEGNQPIKTRQTLFSEIDGRIVQWKSMTTRVHRTKSVQREIKHNQAFLCKNKAFVSQNFSSSRNKNSFPYQVNTAVLEKKKSDSSTTPGIQTYLGPVEAVPNSLYSILDLSSFSNQVNPVSYQNLDIPWFLQQFAEDHAQSYEETWDHLNNPTLKKIALAKKHGLGAIEPPQAVNLGLLSVIATRIGASEKTYTKLPFFNKADLESPNLRTVVIKNKLKNSLYFKKKNNQKLTNITNLLESQSKNFIGGFTKQSFFNKESVTKIVAQRFLQLHTHMDHLQHLNTVAEQGDLVDEDYAQVYCDPLSR